MPNVTPPDDITVTEREAWDAFHDNARTDQASAAYDPRNWSHEETMKGIRRVMDYMRRRLNG
jgi:hypothetical protein